MSDLGDRAVAHPEWDKIREELCGEADAGNWQSEKIELAPGAYVWTGGTTASKEALKKSDMFSELCWIIHQGTKWHLQNAPAELKPYLQRLDLL